MERREEREERRGERSEERRERGGEGREKRGERGEEREERRGIERELGRWKLKPEMKKLGGEYGKQEEWGGVKV